MIFTLIVLALSMFFFIQGKIRADIVAISATTLLMISGTLNASEALSGFSNSIVIMMVGLFIVGGAVFRTGLAKTIGTRIVKLAGNNEVTLLIVVFLVTVFMGWFLSNTGTVALMLPIVVSMALGANIGPERLLIPLAFASSIGGMFTLIGTPPNMVINDALINAGEKGLHFFSFAPVGFVSLIVSLIMIIPLSKLLTKKSSKNRSLSRSKKSLGDLATEYNLFQNIVKVRVQANSPFVGKKLQDLFLPARYNLIVTEVEKPSLSSKILMKSQKQEIAGPSTLLASGDTLHLLGALKHIEKLIQENQLELITNKNENKVQKTLKFLDIGIAEVLLLPDSSLIHKTVLEARFRTRYGVNILGVHRQGEYLIHDLKEVHFKPRDILLVQGHWESIQKLSEEINEWVVLGQPLEEATKETLDHKMPLAAIILVGMILSMVLELIPPVASVLVAAILMILTGCLRNVEDAYKSINWESIVLIAAMLPMSIALQKTGISQLISTSLVESLGSYGVYAILAGIYFTTSLMTMFISNTATAVLLAPIALSAAQSMNVSPYAFLFAVSVAASMCFASPFSTPPNALVMVPGRYTFMDYIRVGLPLQLVMGVVMVFALPVIFPFFP